MATPLSADRLLDTLRDGGLRVVEERNWRTHNRNHKGPWGPMHGVMIHHTVTTGTASSVDLCYNGYSGLPGPLCHGVIAKDGTVHLVGNGRANHAGNGDEDVLEAVVKELALPVDDEANVDGNRHFYGFECVNLGDNKDPWPEAQVEAIARSAAAICRAHGWSERSVIGHSEWQPGKIDPRGPIGKRGGPALTMNLIRARVAQLLADDNAPAPAPSKPTTPAKPAPSKSKPATGSSSGPARYQTTVNGLTYGHGAQGAHVTKVGQALVRRGFGKHYQVGPGPNWSDADTLNYAAYQRSLGYSGKDADGVPGETSLKRLLGTLPAKTPPKPRYEPFPGAAFFSPGRRSPIITALGRRLVALGFGKHYQSGPGPHWTNADRRNVADFQRSRPELAGDPDGIPGPKTWDALKVPKQL